MLEASPLLRTGLLSLIFLLGVGHRLRGAEAAEPVPPVQEDWPSVRDATFAMVWQTVNEAYFDPTFGGVDWSAVREQYRPRLAQAADKPALRMLLQSMLFELKKSHFAVLPRELSVFTPQERSRVGTSGIEAVAVDDVIAVRSVEPGSPGAAAGVHVGDVIRQFDDVAVAPLVAWWHEAQVAPARIGLSLAGWANQWLRGPVGSSVTLRLLDPAGEERTTTLTFVDFRGEWSEPVGSLPSQPIVVATECSTDGIGYLRFNIFTRQAMKDIRALLRRLPPAGGLVIDLRGNGGGLSVMASGISGWLSSESFPLGAMQLRDGHLEFTVTPQAGAFLGPVAILVDAGSASTSEIMAAGLQEAGRARIFGEPTPGAALPSLFKTLPSGDLLQYAIADLQTPRGRLIEGNGVTPDEVVPTTIADLAAGRDPVRVAATAWINAERSRKQAPVPSRSP